MRGVDGIRGTASGAGKKKYEKKREKIGSRYCVMCDGCALAIVYTYACDDETALFACDGLCMCSYIIICDQVGTYMP